MKAIIFDKIETGEIIDDPAYYGGQKFVFGDCSISVKLIVLKEKYLKYQRLNLSH